MTNASPRPAARKRFRAERTPHDEGALSALGAEMPAHAAKPRSAPETAAAAPADGLPETLGAAGDLAVLRADLAEMRKMLEAILAADSNGAAASAASAEGEMDTDVAVRIEIARMVKMIGQAKSEIALIKHPGAETNRIEDARSELDAIVGDTAQATDEILGRAEEQMDLLTRLAGAVAGDTEAEALCAKVEEATIKIMEACNFQDLTGQRTSKVISTLRHIEERIVAMIGIWGIEAFEDLPIPLDDEELDEDAALLNGPARAGEGISQADIDALFD